MLYVIWCKRRVLYRVLTAVEQCEKKVYLFGANGPPPFNILESVRSNYIWHFRAEFDILRRQILFRPILTPILWSIYTLYTVQARGHQHSKTAAVIFIPLARGPLCNNESGAAIYFGPLLRLAFLHNLWQTSLLLSNDGNKRRCVCAVVAVIDGDSHQVPKEATTK